MKRQIDGRPGQREVSASQWTPVIYISRHVPTDEIMMLYRIADVAMVTPIIDGMNLVARNMSP